MARHFDFWSRRRLEAYLLPSELPGSWEPKIRQRLLGMFNKEPEAELPKRRLDAPSR